MSPDWILRIVSTCCRQAPAPLRPAPSHRSLTILPFSNIMFSAMIGFIVTVNSMLDFFTRFYITVVTILWGCSVSFLILFLPKLQEFFKRQKQQYHHQSPTGSSSDVETKHSNGHGPNGYSVFPSSAVTSGFQLHSIDNQLAGEVISLDQILASDPPILSSRHRKGSLGSTFVDENGKSTGSFIEAHEGKMPMRRVFRYFPFLAQWDMLHIMVFPWSGYFSYFSVSSALQLEYVDLILRQGYLRTIYRPNHREAVSLLTHTRRCFRASLGTMYSRFMVLDGTTRIYRCMTARHSTLGGHGLTDGMTLAPCLIRPRSYLFVGDLWAAAFRTWWLRNATITHRPTPATSSDQVSRASISWIADPVNRL